jgi:hypothetical protein
MISRRSFLGGLAAATVAAPLLTQVAEAASMSLVITNQSGRGPLWVYVVGVSHATANYPVLHDFVEFTYDGAGMHCNTTMVDMLSVPLAISLSGASQQSAGRLRDGGRAAVFSALRAQPAFARLVLEDLRGISPGHGLNAGLFAADYFAAWIDEVWNHFRTRTMTVTAGARTFRGSVQGEQFMFDNGVRAFTKPSTRDVLFCDGALAAPNDGVTGPVAAAVGHQPLRPGHAREHGGRQGIRLRLRRRGRARPLCLGSRAEQSDRHLDPF